MTLERIHITNSPLLPKLLELKCPPLLLQFVDISIRERPEAMPEILAWTDAHPQATLDEIANKLYEITTS